MGKVKKSRIRVTKGLSAGIRDHAQYPHLIQLFENLCGLIIQTHAHLTSPWAAPLVASNTPKNNASFAD